jgi:hypothetical protein
MQYSTNSVAVLLNIKIHNIHPLKGNKDPHHDLTDHVT